MTQGISMRRTLGFLAASAIVTLVGGCGVASRDPWEDPGTWRATGANDTNLQYMIANPNDLISGQGDRKSNGVIATTSVNRWLTDKTKPLPAPGGFTAGGGGGGSSGGGQASGPQ